MVTLDLMVQKKIFLGSWVQFLADFDEELLVRPSIGWCTLGYSIYIEHDGEN